MCWKHVIELPAPVAEIVIQVNRISGWNPTQLTLSGGLCS